MTLVLYFISIRKVAGSLFQGAGQGSGGWGFVRGLLWGKELTFSFR